VKDAERGETARGINVGNCGKAAAVWAGGSALSGLGARPAAIGIIRKTIATGAVANVPAGLEGRNRDELHHFWGSGTQTPFVLHSWPIEQSSGLAQKRCVFAVFAIFGTGVSAAKEPVGADEIKKAISAANAAIRNSPDIIAPSTRLPKCGSSRTIFSNSARPLSSKSCKSAVDNLLHERTLLFNRLNLQRIEALTVFFRGIPDPFRYSRRNTLR
jgi:hypothetical protein